LLVDCSVGMNAPEKPACSWTETSQNEMASVKEAVRRITGGGGTAY
jgi:hypothetical protein